jgi:hypothetical protein
VYLNGYFTSVFESIQHSWYHLALETIGRRRRVYIPDFGRYEGVALSFRNVGALWLGGGGRFLYFLFLSFGRTVVGVVSLGRLLDDGTCLGLGLVVRRFTRAYGLHLVSLWSCRCSRHCVLKYFLCQTQDKMKAQEGPGMSPLALETTIQRVESGCDVVDTDRCCDVLKTVARSRDAAGATC